jgi:hypothetical protein
MRKAGVPAFTAPITMKSGARRAGRGAAEASTPSAADAVATVMIQGSKSAQVMMFMFIHDHLVGTKSSTRSPTPLATLVRAVRNLD